MRKLFAVLALLGSATVANACDYGVEVQRVRVQRVRVEQVYSAPVRVERVEVIREVPTAQINVNVRQPRRLFAPVARPARIRVKVR